MVSNCIEELALGMMACDFRYLASQCKKALNYMSGEGFKYQVDGMAAGLFECAVGLHVLDDEHQTDDVRSMIEIIEQASGGYRQPDTGDRGTIAIGAEVMNSQQRAEVMGAVRWLMQWAHQQEAWRRDGIIE